MMLTLGLFIQKAFGPPDQRFQFFAGAVAVVISICLHELAHGWVAIAHGDDTPRRSGHMTGNPLVHMGPWSLAALAIAGIAWGQMPINPSRLRGKYAEAKVAAAGPAMNLLLAFVSLTALALWERLAPGSNSDPMWQENLKNFLWWGGVLNIVLCLFNLAPVPPLDGSHILANLNHRYRDFLSNPNNSGIFFVGFVLVFIFAQAIFTAAQHAANWWVNLIVMTGAG
ncbi:MAG: site-2 protease family protein [Phycisphaeraceae bacterium]|nr:site-2 protease family protein [Phycisphaeraceae bacterium]